MNSWVTGPRSAPPILRSDALTSSFLSFCQNWYTQPERVVGGEHLGRQPVEDLLERVAALRREPQPHARIVEPEDARQDLGGEPGRHRPAVGLAQLGGQLLALGQRDRRPVLRVEQQVVLGQEPGEQQPVPLLVRALGDEQLPIAAELAPLRPQPIAQRRLLGVEVLRPAVGEHAQPLDRSTRRALRRAPRRQHRRLQLLAKRRRTGRASSRPQMITVLSASRWGCTCVAQLVEVGVEVVGRS